MDEFKKGTIETSELFQYFYRNAPYGTNKLEYARDMYFKAQQSSFYPNLSWEARFIVSQGGSRPDSYKPKSLLEIAQWMDDTSDKTPTSTTQTSPSATKTTNGTSTSRSTSNDKFIYQSRYNTKGQKQLEQWTDRYAVTAEKPARDKRFQSRYNSSDGQKELKQPADKYTVTAEKPAATPQYKNLKQLQQFLQAYGYYDESGMNSRVGNDDGIMGPKTLKAIQRLGVEMGIYDGKIDGLMGPKTRKVLNALLNNKQQGLEAQKAQRQKELEEDQYQEAQINAEYDRQQAYLHPETQTQSVETGDEYQLPFNPISSSPVYRFMVTE